MAKKPNNQQLQQQAPVKPPVINKTAAAPKDWFTVTNLCIALGIISVLLYINTLVNGYVLDDVMVLKDNLIVKKGISGIGELLTTPHMRGYLIIPNDLYRPLSLVMFAIEYSLFGLSPAWNHFFSVLTFAGCVMMLFLFLDKFFDRKKTVIAFVAALVFAVHPIHTEVVANIKSRDELLCYFFAFWAMNAFMNYMDKGKVTALIGGTVLLFLSYISKETVITFLAIIPLVFFLYHNTDKKRAILIMAGTVAATAVFLVIRTVVLNKYNANQADAGIDFMDNALVNAPSVISKIATEFVIIGKYLSLMFIPYPLLCNHSYNSIPFSGVGDIWFWLSIAAYLFMAYVVVTRLMKDKKDMLAFSIIFFVVTLSLFSNFPFLMGAELAERFAFFASTGICIAAALAAEHWIIKEKANELTILKSQKVLMMLVPLVLVFGGMTIARNADWKDDYNLYKTDVEKSPNDSRLYQYLATAIAENKYPDEPDTTKRHEMDKESVGYLQKALSIYPDFSEAHVELGRIYDREHMYDSAVIHDEKALKLKPMNATANNNLGSVYITMGKYREAIPYLKASQMANPNFKFVYLNLARCYKQLQVFDSAVINYRQMLSQFGPDDYDGNKELATVYFLQQKYDSAEAQFAHVVALKPDDPDTWNIFGASYLNAKKYPQAIEQFKKAITINPNYINAYSNLGRAYYLSGQYQLAIDILTKEVSLNPQNGRDVPYIALSYQKLGNMAMARQYEVVAKKVYSDFKLE